MERMSEEKQENQQAEGQTQAKEYKPTRYSDTLYGCGACGQEIRTGEKTCPRCGRKIQW